MKTAIVTTTINLPPNLPSYFENLGKNDHRDVEFIVIGDMKSPADTGEYLARLAGESGFTIHWWDVDRQREWLKDLPELDLLIAYNSVQRRNLGYLQAAAAGAECIITIDDDNYATDDDYLAGHGIIGKTETLPIVSSSTGWFNTGSILVTEPAKPLYHRGYPLNMRGIPEELTRSTAEGRVVANAGMWLETPDADAMCHLDVPVEVTGFADGFEGRIAVAHGTCMVFNSQNTAFHRDTLPAMFLIPMGEKIGPLMVNRYDDIWMSIFFKVVADQMGDYVCAGRPLVRQIRNEHDLLQDALWENPAQRMTLTLTDILPKIELTESTYGNCYRQLAGELRGHLNRFTSEEQVFLEQMLRRMEAWVSVSEKFL